MSQISDQLWIGSYDNINSSQFLNERRITHMLSCAPDLSWHPSTLEHWLHIPVTGSSDLKDAAKKIDDWIQAGHTVIVYCHQGIDQSVSTAIAYLILYKRWSFLLALSHVLRLRNGSTPNTEHIYLIKSFQPITQSEPSKTLANSLSLHSQQAMESCSQVASPSPTESEERSTLQRVPSDTP